MIERVARCFAHGGRGLLRSPTRPFRTRRCLHSTFWLHGAGNINLPAWWIFLLQTPTSHLQGPSSKKRQKVAERVTAGIQEIFLDFLYPAQTHALIRRLKRSTNTHRQAAQLAQQSSRQYTSIAEDILAGNPSREEDAQEKIGEGLAKTGSQQNPEALRIRVEKLLRHRTGPEDYDRLWKLHLDALETSNPFENQILQDMFHTLTTSERAVDLERSLALFETMTKTNTLYELAVGAALRLKDLDTAIAIHNEAISTTLGAVDIGTSALLNYAIEQRHWTVAIDIWYRLWQNRFAFFSMQDSLWKDFDTLRLGIRINRANAAADFAISMLESTGTSIEDQFSRASTVAASEFAVNMAERAFKVEHASFNPERQVQLLEKAKTLVDDSKSLCYMAMRQLLQMDRPWYCVEAVRIYRDLRQDPSFTPSFDTLQFLVERFIVHRSTPGLLMVTEDWPRFTLTKLPAGLHVSFARIFAGEGQLEAIEQLFKQYLDDYGHTETEPLAKAYDKICNFMLWVYLKRADTRGILRAFEELQDRHGFIPSTVSYNLIIMAFARLGDMENALNWFQTLRDKGLRPNTHTFSTLIAMYAKRGDVDAVNELLQSLTAHDLKLDTSIVNSLVVVNIKDENYARARDLLEKALLMDLKEPRTHMWNILLNAYALRSDLQNVRALHQRMQEAGVPEDGKTYAALLMSLTVAKNPPAAWKVMNDVMPRLGIRRTPIHFAIIMLGFLRRGKEKDIQFVFTLYQKMLRYTISPGMNIQNILLRAAARRDEAETPADALEIDYKRAREVLDQTIQNLDPAELATDEPRKFALGDALDQAFISSYYEYMIFLYGLEASFDRVSSTYDSWLQTAERFGQTDIENSPPVMMLSALLTAHRRAGNDEEVDRCWCLALEKAEKLSQRFKSNLAKPGWVLPARRFIINVPLRQYMQHLIDRGRIDDLINVINDVRKAGYELHSPMWNRYVQCLAQSPETRHRHLAFELCEQQLMVSWLGWAQMAGSSGSVWRMKRALKSEASGGEFLTHKRSATYVTMVILAAAYTQAKSGYSVGKDEVGRMALERLAPKTTEAVKQLPKINDWQQDKWLEGGGWLS